MITVITLNISQGKKMHSLHIFHTSTEYYRPKTINNGCQNKVELSTKKISKLETTVDIMKRQYDEDLNSPLVFVLLKTTSDNSIGSYSLLRFRLKNPAHSVHVFLLPTQKTAEMPTINVIRYFIINKANSGRVSVLAYKKVNNKNVSDTFRLESSLYSQCKT